MRDRPERHVPYADPGTPDIRGPWRFLFWLIRSQWRRVALGTTYGTLWMLALLLPPYVTAWAVDRGLQGHDYDAVLVAALVIFALGGLIATLGILRHRTMTFIRIDGAYRTVQGIAKQAARLGATLPRHVAAGDLANAQGADAARIAQTLTVTGPGVGAVIAYIATAIVLFKISPLLAVVLLVGVPVMAVTIGPLLARVQKAETDYREHQGRLTDQASDIVSGLRVLGGIGGKPAFARRYRERSATLQREGYRVAAATSWVEAVAACLPTLFLAAVVWIAARMAAEGSISIGDMVAVYGYVAVLVVPVSFFVESTDDITRGLVSARRVIAVLALQPDIEGNAEAAVASRQRVSGDLHDPESGLTVPAGQLVGLVSHSIADVTAVADRLGRYVDSAVTLGEQLLTDLSLADVRRCLLVTGNDARLFAGTVRSMFRTDSDEARIHAALHVANAEDVVASLPGGLDARLEPNGRNLSGGQRQRLLLARAIDYDPEVVILIDPTSAVDAHTETIIAARLRSVYAGRTTVVATTSPLLLGMCDQVVHLLDGQVVATGTHADLSKNTGYAALVYRGQQDGTVEVGGPPVNAAAAGGS